MCDQQYRYGLRRCAEQDLNRRVLSSCTATVPRTVAQRFDRDFLFLKTLEELHSRVDEGSGTYDLIQASGLIRKLLLDDSTLVHQVNRSRQLRIEYRYVELRVPENVPLTNISIGFGFDGIEGMPNGAMFGHHVCGKESQLLAAKVLYFAGETITVREIVRHAAYALGGVHPGKPTERSAAIERAAEQQAAILEDARSSLDPATTPPEHLALVNAMAQLTRVPGGLATLRAIGRVVYQGLLPLGMRVVADYEGTGKIAADELLLPIPEGLRRLLGIGLPETPPS